MCNTSCIIFGAINLNKDEISGRRIIEVGSLDVNGSLRPIIASHKPTQYIGVDILEGPGVDIVCSAENIIEKFGKESFDVLISTELIEHVRNWRRVISNIKNICKANGVILITTRSFGYDYHAYPNDFWRYEIEDMKNIFSDCIIEKMEKDRLSPGVLLKVRKTADFMEKDLSNYELYSVVLNRRTKELEEKEFEYFKKRYLRKQILKEKIKRFIYEKYKWIFSKIP